MLAQLPGLVAWLIRAREVMLVLDQHPYGRYLLLTQVAFLAGMMVGWLLVEESGDLFGWLLVEESRNLLGFLSLVAALCGMVSMLFLLPIGASSRRWEMHLSFLWPSLFLALTGMGAAMLLDEGVNEVFMQLLRVCVWLTPLWAVLLGVTRAGWLLRPYGWRQLLSDQLPRRVRTSLVFLLLTAALPLGGLAIPLWIYVHHRLGHGLNQSQP